MRLILALLLMVPMLASGAVVRLTDCGTLPATISEAEPFDLDACNLQDGDDITTLLTDIATEWGDVYVRAPSKTVWVEADYAAWTQDNFYFLEDQSARNRLLIQHNSTYVNSADFYTLWQFTNYINVKIGGPNLSITIRGNHPGLGNCRRTQYPTYIASSICDGTPGLLTFTVNDGSKPTLADVRANIAYAQGDSLRFNGSQSEGDVINKVQQVNIAGLHYATGGVNINGGVRRVWFDPDRMVLSDPYLRTHGWDGAIARTEGGYPLGCFDIENTQSRGSGVQTVAAQEMTGGATFEYGIHSANQRSIGRIGSASQPFILRIKDWGASGPGTAYPAGVRSKRQHQPILFKGDPAPDLGEHPTRFIHLIKLPDTYGSGVYGGAIVNELCAEGNETDNFYNSGTYNVMRLEANGPADATNHGYAVTFSGDWDANFWRGSLFFFHYAPNYSTNRSWQHVLRAADGMTFTDTITLNDTNTVTGPGTFTNLATADVVGTVTLDADNNVITDTNVSGVIAIGAATGTTTISNVNMTGSATDLITVGAGSTVNISNLCIASGKRVTGAGTATYEGSGLTLPYTFGALAECSITGNERPDAPGVN